MSNKARPEGSIAEAYIVNECLTFVSMYLRGIETKFNRDERNYDRVPSDKDSELSVFSRKVRPYGKGKFIDLTEQELDMIQRYVLNNTEGLDTYMEYVLNDFLPFVNILHIVRDIVTFVLFFHLVTTRNI